MTLLHVRRSMLQFGMVVVLLSLLASLLVVRSGQASAADRGPVVVSLTWDDGRASQANSTAIQQSRGFPATYYVNSGWVGTSRYYLTKPQLDTIAAAGNEIGGHTSLHENLTKIPAADASASVCNDRQTLMSWYGPGAGASFAYPYGAANAGVENIVRDCGYTSARSVTGILSQYTCFTCRPSESIPPRNPYRLATPTSVSPSTTLADLQFQVENAALNGGGWVIYVMHDIGVPGDSLNIDPVLYGQFLDWLKTRSDVSVRTVGDVIANGVPSTSTSSTTTSTTPSSTTTSTTTPPPPPVPVSIPNAGLEGNADGNPVSDCWLRGYAGTNTAAWTRTTASHSGSWAEEVTISAFTSGDRKLVSALDGGTANGGCAPSVDSNHSYRLSAWYRSTAQTRFVVFLRDSAGAWKYWRTGPWLNSSAGWSEGSYETGQLPAGTTALSYGITISAIGTLTTDDYSMSAIALPPAPPAPRVDAIVKNSSLEADVDSNGVPDCWLPSGYGTNSFAYSRVSDAHTGIWGEKLTVSSFTSGDRRMVQTIDKPQSVGGCAPDAVPGTRYRLGAWFHSDATPRLIAFYLDSGGVWRWWVSATVGTPTDNWTEASIVTPPAPAGATALSFGIGLASTGTIVTDDYSVSVVP
jgi:peptidoglycan/xylan/chitin deacetylase (PgdA/CDA1 family)